MPAGWDFPHVQADKFGLPEVRVGVWAGFVFINLDPKAPSLEDYVGDLAKHNAAFAYPWEKRYKAVHGAKVIPCNWKIGMEAFLESYHVAMTHGTGRERIRSTTSMRVSPTSAGWLGGDS